jgi:microcystin-dependent protein
MKELRLLTGGMPVYLNDLVNMQTELLDSVQKQYAGLGACVISGCDITGNSITDGLVYIDGKVRRFTATTFSVVSYMHAATTTEDSRSFEQGSTNNVYNNFTAVLSTTPPGIGEYLTVTPFSVMKRVTLGLGRGNYSLVNENGVSNTNLRIVFNTAANYYEAGTSTAVYSNAWNVNANVLYDFAISENLTDGSKITIKFSHSLFIQDRVGFGGTNRFILGNWKVHGTNHLYVQSGDVLTFVFKKNGSGSGTNDLVLIDASIDTSPTGLIIMWSGSSVPIGYQLCNGSTVSGGFLNGKTTPDLRGRFVVGFGGITGTGENPSDYSNPGSKSETNNNVNNSGNAGGEAKHQLTIAEMPSHNHTTNTKSTTLPQSGSNTHVWFGDAQSSTGFAGSDVPHENRPPYYTLAFLMKVR